MQRIDEGCKTQPRQHPRRGTLGAVQGQPLHSFTSAVRLPLKDFSWLLLWPSLSHLLHFCTHFTHSQEGEVIFLQRILSCEDELNYFSLNYFCFESKSRSFTLEKELELFKPIFQQLQVTVIFSNSV